MVVSMWGGQKKTAGLPAVFWVLRVVCVYAFASPAARRGENQKYVKK
jgi:hypothetical protein